MSVKLIRDVFAYAPRTLPSSHRFVLVCLAEDARDHDRIARYSSAEKLAELTGYTPSSIRRILPQLVDLGLIQRIGPPAHRGRIQQYRIAQLEAHHRAAGAMRTGADSASAPSAIVHLDAHRKRTTSERNRAVDNPRRERP